MSILDKIIATKREEVAALKASPSSHLGPIGDRSPLPFVKALKTHPFPAIIAEVKKASPSKGVIREDFDAIEIAREFSTSGAAALSVLTDEKYFQGSLDYLLEIRKTLEKMPLLRKDFIIDAIQIEQALGYGADCILLIAAALKPDTVKALLTEALARNLDILLEVHSIEEFETIGGLFAGNTDNVALGINNRDLHTFETSLETTERIAKIARERFGSDLLIVSESGIFKSEEMLTLKSYSANAFLIGESLVKSGSPRENLTKLIENSRDD